MSKFIARLNTPRGLHLVVYLFFLAVTVLITWPLVTVFTTHFAGYDFGDAHEMTRHIWWFKYAAQHGQPLIFQPLLGYPDGMQGVILWSDPLQFFPGWLFAFVMPLPAAYNFQLLLTLALNGWAAYFLVWKVTDQRLPALLTGVVFLAAPTLQGHLAGGHGGLLVQWPLPLLAYALLRLRETTRQPNIVSGDAVGEGFKPSPTNPFSSFFSRFPLSTRYAALTTLFFVLLPLGHTLQLIYAGLPLIIVFGLTLLVERNWRGLLHLILAVGVGCLILAIFLIPVFQATFGTSAYKDEGGGVAYSIDLLAVLTPSFNHPVFGGWDYTHRVLGVNIVEGSSYVGIVAGLLGIIAIWKRRSARWWLLLALVAWVLALGPLLKIFDQPVSLRNAEYSTFITLPWSLLADLPGFNLARTPGRFNFLLALSVAVLAGYGLSTLLASKRFSPGKQPSAEPAVASPSDQPSAPSTSSPSLSPQSTVLSTFLALVLLAFILLDYQSFWPLPTYSAEIPQAVHDLSTRENVRAVFDMPWDNLLAAKDALWLQTAHEKPIIAGQVTRRTPVSPAKLTILEQTLDPALLDEAGADVVILHKTYDYDGSLGTSAHEKLGEPFYEDDKIAMWDAPEANSPSEIWFAPAPWLPAYHLEDLQYLMPSEVPLSLAGDEITSELYVPETGWLSYRLNLLLQPSTTATLYLDDRPIRQVTSLENLWIPIAEPGYHSVKLALQPSCPQTLASSFFCGFLWPSDFLISDFVSDPLNQPITFDNGITIKGSNIPNLQSHQILFDVTLWWQFDEQQTDQDIRFIKVLDENGNVVASSDNPLGAQPAGSEWIETIRFGIPDAPGTYSVYVGWYSYPDLTRFPVLSDVPGAQDGWAKIGEFTNHP